VCWSQKTRALYWPPKKKKRKKAHGPLLSRIARAPLIFDNQSSTSPSSSSSLSLGIRAKAIRPFPFPAFDFFSGLPDVIPACPAFLFSEPLDGVFPLASATRDCEPLFGVRVAAGLGRSISLTPSAGSSPFSLRFCLSISATSSAVKKRPPGPRGLRMA